LPPPALDPGPVESLVGVAVTATVWAMIVEPTCV
jgi:hypothetical protein